MYLYSRDIVDFVDFQKRHANENLIPRTPADMADILADGVRNDVQALFLGRGTESQVEKSFYMQRIVAPHDDLWASRGWLSARQGGGLMADIQRHMEAHDGLNVFAITTPDIASAAVRRTDFRHSSYDALVDQFGDFLPTYVEGVTCPHYKTIDEARAYYNKKAFLLRQAD